MIYCIFCISLHVLRVEEAGSSLKRTIMAARVCVAGYDDEVMIIHRRVFFFLVSKVIGMVFVPDGSEVITGSKNAVFMVWRLPGLVLKQRFTRSSCSPMVRLVYPSHASRLFNPGETRARWSFSYVHSARARLFVALRSYPWLSSAILGYPWLSLTILGHIPLGSCWSCWSVSVIQ